MARDLPSIIALQAFEAALRHESFTRAGQELHRSQGAISRQVAALEDRLGLLLFEREPPRVRPTPAAMDFGRKVRGVLNRLSAIMLEIETSAAGGGVLDLGVLPTFGTRWLIPRIPGFHESEPGVSINLTTRIAPFDFEAGDLDAAIHHGEGFWPGARLERLMEDEVLVVASPALLQGTPLHSPADLHNHVLLQLESRLTGWGDLLRKLGLPTRDARLGPRFEHHLMVIQAAIAGLGIALLPAFLVVPELEAGTLIQPLPELRMRTGRAYWLAYPQRSVGLPALEAFRTWLRARLKQEGLWAGDTSPRSSPKAP